MTTHNHHLLTTATATQGWTLGSFGTITSMGAPMFQDAQYHQLPVIHGMPKVGEFIRERKPWSQPRAIIEVACGQYIVTKGKRRSMIQWQNLHRYGYV